MRAAHFLCGSVVSRRGAAHPPTPTNPPKGAAWLRRRAATGNCLSRRRLGQQQKRRVAGRPPRLPVKERGSADRRGGRFPEGTPWLAGCPLETPSVRTDTRTPWLGLRRGHPGLLGVPWTRLRCTPAPVRRRATFAAPPEDRPRVRGPARRKIPRGDTLACWVSPGHAFAAHRHPSAAAPPSPPLPRTDLESADRRGERFPEGTPWLAGCPLDTPSLHTGTRPPPRHLRRPSRGQTSSPRTGEAKDSPRGHPGLLGVPWRRLRFAPAPARGVFSPEQVEAND